MPDREIAGIDAIWRWVEKEMVGDKVTLDVQEVANHYGDIIVRAAYDGEFDRPTCRIRWSCRITSARGMAGSFSLAVIRNTPSPY